MKKPSMLLVLLASGIPVVFAGGIPEAAQDPTGYVYYFEGDVKLDGVEVEIGQDVEPGSEFQVGSGSLLEVEFRSQNLLQFRENSSGKIYLDENEARAELERAPWQGP